MRSPAIVRLFPVLQRLDMKVKEDPVKALMNLTDHDAIVVYRPTTGFQAGAGKTSKPI